MSSLSIAVIGVGGIGSTFAYQLARAGHDVTAVARAGSVRLQQLRRDGGIVKVKGERADMRVSEALDEQIAYDLVVVTTLAHQVDALLPALLRSKAKCIHFMFNNLAPERLQAALGAHRCSFGMPFVMATVTGEGKLDATIRAAQKSLHGDRRWVSLFGDAGIPSAYAADMLLWLRCHAPMCVAFESISVAGERRGGGATWAESWVVARGMQGGLSVVKALGNRLYPPAKAILSGSPTFVVAAMLWAVSRIPSFRTLLATGVHECRALADALMAAAAAAQPPLAAAAADIAAMRPAVDPPKSRNS